MEVVNMDAPLLAGGPYHGQRTKRRGEVLKLSHYMSGEPFIACYLYLHGIYLFSGYVPGAVE